MKYILMNKNTPVVKVRVNKQNNEITKVLDKYSEDHLPVGVLIDGQLHTENLSVWWRSRSIPASREYLMQGLACLGFTEHTSSSSELLSRCFGLSLSDQYWMKPENSCLSWKDINFFTNSFSEDIGKALFDNQYVNNADFNSPDNTSDGIMKKKWKIINGKRCLLKSGTGTVQQEAFNEVIANEMCKALNIQNYVPYMLELTAENAISISKNFIDENTELVSAYYVMQTKQRDNCTSYYDHYLDCCSELGLDVREQTDRQIILDYLMCNTDRHFGNFGIIRNVENLSFTKAAPIFDNGTSLFCTKTVAYMNNFDLERCPSKPFRRYHEEQIKLVGNADFIEFGRLEQVSHKIKEIIGINDFIDEKRTNALSDVFSERVKMLDNALCKGYYPGINSDLNKSPVIYPKITVGRK